MGRTYVRMAFCHRGPSWSCIRRENLELCPKGVRVTRYGQRRQDEIPWRCQRGCCIGTMSGFEVTFPESLSLAPFSHTNGAPVPQGSRVGFLSCHLFSRFLLRTQGSSLDSGQAWALRHRLLVYDSSQVHRGAQTLRNTVPVLCPRVTQGPPPAVSPALGWWPFPALPGKCGSPRGPGWFGFSSVPRRGGVETPAQLPGRGKGPRCSCSMLGAAPLGWKD